MSSYDGPSTRFGTAGAVWRSRAIGVASAFIGALSVLCVAGSPVSAQQVDLDLSWNDNSSNEDGFRIERKLGPTGSFSNLATVGPNTVTYNDTAVNAGVTYCYRVKAFNAAGESGYTNEVCSMPSVTSSASPPPTISSSSSSGAGSSQTASAPASGGGGGGGCFIATAAFGSPLAPQVQLLREMRDRYLLPNWLGRLAVQAYYAGSPPIADVISRSETLRLVTRLGLAPVLGWAALALWSPVVGIGIPALSVVAGVWLIGRRPRNR